MVCIYCSGPTAVVNSRPRKRQNSTWRRRECVVCFAVFTTIEAVDLSSSLAVVDASGQFKPFSRDLLFISIYESLRHRNTASDDATALTDTVIAHLIPASTAGSLAKRQIIAETSEVLQRFDMVAATYYAAYHPAT